MDFLSACSSFGDCSRRGGMLVTVCMGTLLDRGSTPLTSTKITAHSCSHRKSRKSGLFPLGEFVWKICMMWQNIFWNWMASSERFGSTDCFSTRRLGILPNTRSLFSKKTSEFGKRGLSARNLMSCSERNMRQGRKTRSETAGGSKRNPRRQSRRFPTKHGGVGSPRFSHGEEHRPLDKSWFLLYFLPKGGNIDAYQDNKTQNPCG